MKEDWENSSILYIDDVFDCGWYAGDHHKLSFRVWGKETIAKCPKTGGLIADNKNRSVDELLDL